MQEGVNLAAPDPNRWVVAEASLIRRYRTELDESNNKRLTAEAAVDELLTRNAALIQRLQEVSEEKERQREEFNEQLEIVRGQLQELQGTSE